MFYKRLSWRFSSGSIYYVAATITNLYINRSIFFLDFCFRLSGFCFLHSNLILKDPLKFFSQQILTESFQIKSISINFSTEKNLIIPFLLDLSLISLIYC